jgi:hypothetical protein
MFGSMPLGILMVLPANPFAELMVKAIVYVFF